MSLAQLAPYIGYIASFFLMIGLLVSSDLKFRIWNGLGCLLFVGYALIIKAPPVLLTNTVLLGINIVYLIKILKRKESFDAVIMQTNDPLLHKFLDFYAGDIAAYFPQFDKNELQQPICIAILRDLVIANVTILLKNENSEARVVLNYTIPRFRDFKVGKFLFEKNKLLLTSQGIHTVYYDAVHKQSHRKFLLRSGFAEQNGRTQIVL